MCPTLPKHHRAASGAPKHDNGTENWGQSRGGRPWARKRERVFKRDGFLCQEHRRQGLLVPVTLHGKGAGICDHVISKAEGGSDHEGNLQTLCRECSNAKTQRESARARARSSEV